MTVTGTHLCGAWCDHGTASYVWMSSAPVITHCPHGLDLRLNARCYLCRPDVRNDPVEDPGPEVQP